MPTITYMGPFYRIGAVDGPGDAFRGVPREVTQEWLDQWRNWLTAKHWKIEGDTVDEGNDGIPDAGWSRKDILSWLQGYDVKMVGYVSKKAALEMVDKVLNPKKEEDE